LLLFVAVMARWSRTAKTRCGNRVLIYDLQTKRLRLICKD
jgi:hypothetical protein